MLAYLQGPHRVRDDGSFSQPPPSRPGAPTGPRATRPTACAAQPVSLCSQAQAAAGLHVAPWRAVRGAVFAPLCPSAQLLQRLDDLANLDDTLERARHAFLFLNELGIPSTRNYRTEVIGGLFLNEYSR